MCRLNIKFDGYIVLLSLWKNLFGFGIIFLVIMYIDFVYVLEIWISLVIKEKKLNVFNNWKKSIWRL